MAVKIRLSRVGRKHVPFFRIVATDTRKSRDGQALEILGTYDAAKGELVQFHEERISYWLSQGAVPTDAFKRLNKKFKKSAPSAAQPQA
jgi:small subunit ribosomal protein S16